MDYSKLTKDELEKELEKLKNQSEIFKKLNLKLDMSRGKPSIEQLNISMDILSVLNKHSNLICKDGTDCRNYGQIDGIIEAKEFLSTFMENKTENIIVYGNSSLQIMYLTVMQGYVFGVMGNTPWRKLDKVKFLCPVPGYDRHFAICEEFGIEMINIPMSETGPDMDMVEKLVESDESIKGIWCVPKYSNPDGYTYSDDTVRRFAKLKPKAKDFRIYWDNAYTVHHLYVEKEKRDYILEILTECEKAGNPDLVYKFASTSKITFPGSGIAALATSINNVADVKKHLKYQTISYDKVNELRHVRFFENLSSVENQMKKHADILRPKFEKVDEILNSELGDKNIARWTKPNGGYFVSFYSMNGLAKKIVAMCRELGVTLTEAGATYPYHIDPDDSNIRIAPSFPNIDDLTNAMQVFTHVVKYCSVEKILCKK